MKPCRVYLVYRKTGQISLRKNKGKVANDYLTQTVSTMQLEKNEIYDTILSRIHFVAVA